MPQAAIDAAPASIYPAGQLQVPHRPQVCTGWNREAGSFSRRFRRCPRNGRRVQQPR